MLTKKDRQELIQDMKQVFVTKEDLKDFATKDDLTAMEKRQDQKFATKDDLKTMEDRQDKKYVTKNDLEPIQKSLKRIEQKLTTTIRFFDKEVLKHDSRLKNIERHVGLPTPVSS